MVSMLMEVRLHGVFLDLRADDAGGLQGRQLNYKINLNKEFLKVSEGERQGSGIFQKHLPLGISFMFTAALKTSV